MSSTSPTTTPWKEGYEALPQAAKDDLAVDESGNLRDIEKLVIQARDNAQDKRLTVKTKSKKIFVVRDAFAKVAKWIERFIQVGDIAMQYDAGHAALPWAAVRFILKACGF